MSRLLRDLGRNNLLLMLSLFMWALGEGLWINLRQLYLADLGAAPQQIGTALAIEQIAKALPLIPAGFLSDRLGAYRVVIASWLLGIGGTILMALAHDWRWAVPGLALYGASAFAIPSVSALALVSIPDESRPMIHQRTLTAIFAAYPAGLIVSPTIGGEIAARFGLRTTLWIGAGLFVLSLGVLIFVRHIEPLIREHHDERARDVLSNRRFRILVIYYAAAALIFMVGFQLAPNYFEQVRRFPLGVIGLLFSVSSLGTVLFNLISGRADRQWSYAFVLAIIWLGMLGAWLAPTLIPAAASFFLLGAIWSARTLAISGISVAVRPHNRGFAFGMLDTVTAIAIAAASGIAGELFAVQPGLPFTLSVVGLPVMTLLWFAVRRTQVPNDAISKTSSS